MQDSDSYYTVSNEARELLQLLQTYQSYFTSDEIITVQQFFKMLRNLLENEDFNNYLQKRPYNYLLKEDYDNIIIKIKGLLSRMLIESQRSSPTIMQLQMGSFLSSIKDLLNYLRRVNNNSNMVLPDNIAQQLVLLLQPYKYYVKGEDLKNLNDFFETMSRLLQNEDFSNYLSNANYTSPHGEKYDVIISAIYSALQHLKENIYPISHAKYDTLLVLMEHFMVTIKEITKYMKDVLDNQHIKVKMNPVEEFISLLERYKKTISFDNPANVDKINRILEYLKILLQNDLFLKHLTIDFDQLIAVDEYYMIISEINQAVEMFNNYILPLLSTTPKNALGYLEMFSSKINSIGRYIDRLPHRDLITISPGLRDFTSQLLKDVSAQIPNPRASLKTSMSQFIDFINQYIPDEDVATFLAITAIDLYDPLDRRESIKAIARVLGLFTSSITSRSDLDNISKFLKRYILRKVGYAHILDEARMEKLINEMQNQKDGFVLFIYDKIPNKMRVATSNGSEQISAGEIQDLYASDIYKPLLL